MAQEVVEVELCRLTTPHKLQAEARLGKPSQAERAVWTPHKPMAEACQLHAVVSLPRGRTASGRLPNCYLRVLGMWGIFMPAATP